MATVLDEIDDKLRAWLLAQPVFFVATAPLGADGHVNVSPKGMAGTFAVLGTHRVAYLDYFGSGVETLAHLHENGRIVVMCCAFDGPPKIVRLHGRGSVVRPDDAGFAALRGEFGKERDLGLRSIIVVDVDRIADSCGFSVPLMQHVGDRDVLDRAQERRDEAYFIEYARTRNATSIDGLPGLAAADVADADLADTADAADAADMANAADTADTANAAEKVSSWRERGARPPGRPARRARP